MPHPTAMRQSKTRVRGPPDAGILDSGRSGFGRACPPNVQGRAIAHRPAPYGADRLVKARACPNKTRSPASASPENDRAAGCDGSLSDYVDASRPRLRRKRPRLQRRSDESSVVSVHVLGPRARPSTLVLGPLAVCSAISASRKALGTSCSAAAAHRSPVRVRTTTCPDSASIGPPPSTARLARPPRDCGRSRRTDRSGRSRPPRGAPAAKRACSRPSARAPRRRADRRPRSRRRAPFAPPRSSPRCAGRYARSARPRPQ